MGVVESRPSTVRVGTGPVAFADVVAVARYDAGVELTAEARDAIVRARAVVDRMAGDETPA